LRPQLQGATLDKLSSPKRRLLTRILRRCRYAPTTTSPHIGLAHDL
jgi:hypothetical protein